MQHRPHSASGDPEAVAGTRDPRTADAQTICAGVHARVATAVAILHVAGTPPHVSAAAHRAPAPHAHLSAAIHPRISAGSHPRIPTPDPAAETARSRDAAAATARSCDAAPVHPLVAAAALIARGASPPCSGDSARFGPTPVAARATRVSAARPVTAPRLSAAVTPASPAHPNLRDPAAFSAAYRKLAPMARAAAISVLRDGEAADDVVQDVFTALWTRPEAYRPERGSLATFVSLMARSRALDRLRSSAAAEAALHRDALEARSRPAAVEPPSEEVIRRDSARVMLSALESLPDGQRAAVLLHHVGGLSDGELARAMHVPLGTAKSRIRLGTRRARAAVEQRLAA
jgi:RNA polymerase sigma-70 factor, ECF subfamily